MKLLLPKYKVISNKKEKLKLLLSNSFYVKIVLIANKTKIVTPL